MDKNANAVSIGSGLLGDVGEDDGFAAAGGQDKEDGAVSGEEGEPDALNGLVLVGAQGEGHGPAAITIRKFRVCRKSIQAFAVASKLDREAPGQPQGSRWRGRPGPALGAYRFARPLSPERI